MCMEMTACHAQEFSSGISFVKNGREDVEDDPKSGRPSTSKIVDNINRVNRMVCGDRRLTARMIAYELGMNRETVRTILTEDLGMR